MKAFVSFVLVLSFVFAGEASALEVNLIKEKYHIKVSYDADGEQWDDMLNPIGDPLHWERSYVKAGTRELSQDIEFIYPGDYASGTWATAEADRFNVYGMACAGPNDDMIYLDPNYLYCSLSTAYFLSEAAWVFTIKDTGSQILTVNYSGGTYYWDQGDDQSMYVSLFKNGTEIFSAYLIPELFMDAMQNIEVSSVKTDVWELRLKVEGSAWDADCLETNFSTNLTAGRSPFFPFLRKDLNFNE